MMNLKPLLLGLALIGGLFTPGSAVAASLSPDTNFRAPSFAIPVLPGRALLLPDGKYLLFSGPNTLTDQRTGGVTRYLADGTLDTSFSFSRAYKTVNAAAPAGGGKVYVAATGYVYGAKGAEQILRLNTDGSIDTSFTPATVGGFDSFPDVYQILVQPDGKLLVAGNFVTFAGNDARDGIVRLLSDGTVDSTFAPVTINGFVYTATLQTDGKVLIGGTINSVNGVADPGVARLNADGSLDSSFQAAGFTRNSSGTRVRAITLQTDGQILLSGNFRVGTGSNPPRMPILRLNPNGTVDATFSSTAVVSTLNTGRDLVLQPDNKIVAVINNSIYRLNTDGSKDTSFRQPSMLDATFDPALAGTPVSLQLYSDGHLLVGGGFTDVDPPGAAGFSHFGVARFSADGTLDSSLVTSHRTGIETAPSAFARLADGSTLVSFPDTVHPPINYNIGRLLPDGSRDSSFTLSSSNPNGFLSGGFNAHGFVQLTDGKFFVFGAKTNTAPAYGKVLASGVEDTAFSAEPSFPGFQSASALPDGKVLLSAGTDPQATIEITLLRLRADGKFDTFLFPQSIRSGQVIRDSVQGFLDQMYVGSRPLAVQPDGKILFVYFASPGNFHLVRLNADGSIDGSFAETTFNPIDLTQSFPVVYDPVKGQIVQPPRGVWTASFPVLDAYIQSDGRIVLAGHFTSFKGTPARGLVRLNPDGTIDSTFNAGGGPQWTQTTETSIFFPGVENLEPQADGKLVISGNFEAFNGVPAPGIASLNPNGSVDTSFVAPAFRDKSSRLSAGLARQLDGSFLLSGPYTFPNETVTSSLIRLVPPATALNIATRITVGKDDNVLIGGFIVIGSAPKQVIIRAIGPSLSANGQPIPGRLLDPMLELHAANGSLIASNDEWRSTQEQAIKDSTVPPTDNRESAIVATLQPGNYTAVMRGKDNSTGIGVVEVYDLDAAAPSQMAQISTRGTVLTGDDVMIGGFILGGSVPVNVLVRAIGPELNGAVPGALQDTTLELHDGNGAVLAFNDDWQSDQEQAIRDTTVPPTDPRESAILRNLSPGNYTAIVRGKSDFTGVALVEVYVLQ